MLSEKFLISKGICIYAVLNAKEISFCILFTLFYVSCLRVPPPLLSACPSSSCLHACITLLSSNFVPYCSCLFGWLPACSCISTCLPAHFTTLQSYLPSSVLSQSHFPSNCALLCITLFFSLHISFSSFL